MSSPIATHQSGQPPPPWDRPSRAHTFIVEVAERHGRPLGDGRVEIPLTQAELARLHGRSPGTVSYYLRCAGSIVVARRHASLVLDLTTLQAGQDNHVESPVSASTEPPPRHLHVAPEPPSPPSPDFSPATPIPSARSDDQVLEIVSTLVACLTQVTTVLAGIAEQLLNVPHTADPANESAKLPADPAKSAKPPAKSANLAGGFSLPSRKKESLPSFPDRENRERTREIRETETQASRSGPGPVAGGEDPLPYELIDEVVAPLRALARRSSRPDNLDDNGRAVLAGLSEAQLRQGVLQAQREATASAAVHKPVGLLVHKALSGQADFFAAPPATAPPPTVVIEDSSGHDEADEEAAVAIAELEAREDDEQELAVVDKEVQSWLASHGGSERMQRLLLRQDRRGLRKAAWRRLRTPASPAEDDATPRAAL